MKKNVNKGLLIMVIILIGIFVLFAVLYQLVLGEKTQDYNDKLTQLDQVQQDLLQHKSKLEETEYELEVKSTREEDLSSKFGDVKGERDNLAVDKTKLETELASTKQQLIDVNAELVQTKFTLSTTMKDLQKQIDKATAADNAYDSCKDDLNDCEDDLAAC